jgi:hypothetical protein
MRKLFYLLLLALTVVSGINCDIIQYKYTYTDNVSLIPLIMKRYIPIYVDKEFSSNDKLSIDNAINQWNYVLNGQIELKVVNYQFDMEPDLILASQTNQGWLILKVNSDNLTIPDDVPYQQCLRTAGCAPTLAWCDRAGGSVMKIVRDRMSSNNVETVTLHELGHLLSLTHVDDINSLMYPRYNKLRYLCVDASSAMKVAANYSLDTRTINYCLNKY